MSDEDLRELERDAASDPAARLRYAEALLRLGRTDDARHYLGTLVALPGELGSLARRRALACAEDPARFASEFHVLASTDELAAMIRETPRAEVPARAILVRALRSRDKRAAQALARELDESDPFRPLLAAEGEMLM